MPCNDCSCGKNDPFEGLELAGSLDSPLYKAVCAELEKKFEILKAKQDEEKS